MIKRILGSKGAFLGWPPPTHSNSILDISLSITSASHFPAHRACFGPTRLPKEESIYHQTLIPKGPWLRMPAHLPTSRCLLTDYLDACHFPPGMVQPATPPPLQSFNVPLVNWEGVGTGMDWGRVAPCSRDNS